MFEYVDVTDDPSAPRHSGLGEAIVAEAGALGFEDVGWIAAIVQPSGSSPASAPLVSRVMRSPDRKTLLALTRFRGRDNASLKTMFEDGSIVSTEQRPPGLEGLLMSWGVEVAPRHAYDLATFRANDLATLVAHHRSRIEREAYRTRPFVDGDLRVHLAVRRRYREIANPRVAKQQAFAGKLSKATFIVIVLAGVGGSLALRESLGNGALFVALLGLLAAAVCSLGAFLLGIMVLAPFIARDVAAPPVRPAAELLLLADDVPRGRVAHHRPVTDDDDDEPAPLPDERPDAPIAVPAQDIARLRRRDTIVSLANALLLPGLGFALIRVLGTAGTSGAFGAIALLDAAILFVMQKSRLDLLRARFVPELVSKEKALVIPLALRWIYAAVGVVALVIARRSLADGVEPAPTWLFGEWAALAALFLWAAWRAARKRHARLVGT